MDDGKRICSIFAIVTMSVASLVLCGSRWFASTLSLREGGERAYIDRDAGRRYIKVAEDVETLHVVSKAV